VAGVRRPAKPARTLRYVHESVMPATPAEVFAFHERPDAFARLQPPWETVEIEKAPDGLEVGTRVELRTRVGPFWQRIVAEHVDHRPGEEFADVMLEGPFAYWHHRHLFLPHEEGCLLRDDIEYAPPMGFLGRWLDPLLVRPRLRRMFTYRHAETRRALEGGAADTDGS